MFEKAFNRYYYGKSGQGDFTVSDLPNNRWEQFWSVLRVRLSGLIRLNLLYMLIWLPAIFVIATNLISMLNTVADADPVTGIIASTGLEVGPTLMGMIQITLLMLIPCILITGPCTAGVSYVLRNWARDEHAFIWSDFKDAFKSNWKQALGISAITAVMPEMVFICWTFYGDMAKQSPIMMVPQVLVLMIGLIWSLAVTYTYPTLVTYKLRFRDVIRNSLLMAIGRLPYSFAARLLACVPLAIAVAVAFLFQVSVGAVILGIILYYVFIGFTLSRFIHAAFTNAAFDKMINSRIEGAEIDRGLNPHRNDPDDDDDDEAE